MNQQLTTGIILRRTDYGEADRIISLLTPKHGKLSLTAKGVRKVKSKLAGGIELFSVSQISFLAPRAGSEIGTLISARLVTHYHHIVEDIDRTMLGYDLIKQLDKATEDNPEPEYFELLQQAFEALNTREVERNLIQIWFAAQLLRLGGHTPNLQTDTAGNKLEPDKSYNFDFDRATFVLHPEGIFSSDEIKFLRLLFSGNNPSVLGKVINASTLITKIAQLVHFMRQQYIR